MPIIIDGLLRLTGKEQLDCKVDTRPCGPIRSKTEEKTLRILGTDETKTVEELEEILHREICD